MGKRYFKVRISNSMGYYDKFYEHFHDAILYIKQCSTKKIAMNVAYQARRLQNENGRISFPALGNICTLESIEGTMPETALYVQAYATKGALV